MSLAVLRVAAGAGLLILLGHAVSGRVGNWWHAGELAVDGAVGLSVALPAVFTLLALGVAMPPRVIAGSEAFAALLMLLARRKRTREHQRARVPRDSRRLEFLAAALLLAAFAVCVWKWTRVPLWSWDHFAIWGMKARKLFPFSSLDLAPLQSPTFTGSVPQYPLGLPLAWRLLALAEPASGAFRAAHVLFALGTLLALRAGAARATGSAAIANSVSAALCVTPLFWDSEALGLAEMPLAFVAVASAALLLGLRHPPRRSGFAIGVTIGCAAWIKEEGMALAGLLLLLGAGIVLTSPALGRKRARRLAGFALPAIGVAALGWGLRRVLLPRGFGFFIGDWKERVLARLQDPAPVLRPLARELLSPDWLGLWIGIAIVSGLALLRRRSTAALVLSVVGIQITGYACVYFFTYLDPAEHIASSFFRIVAGTVPLALLGAALLAERLQPPGEETSDECPAPGGRT